jgi:hypothetical protein
MSASYYLRAGGQTRSAGDLGELGELVEGAITADDPIELICSSGGSPLNDAEFRGLMRHIPLGPLSRARGRRDVRADDD